MNYALPSQAQIDQVLATLPGGCCRKWGVVCPACHARNHVKAPRDGAQTCPECGAQYRLPKGALTAQEARGT